MKDYIDAEHIRQMILEGTVERLPATVATEAGVHLNHSYRLHTKTTTWVIDWDVTPSTSLRWSEVTDDEAVTWARQTVAGRSAFGLLLFSSDQPCLLGKFDFMIEHLDELVWKAAGNRLLFGVERRKDGSVVFNPGVIEFNGRGGLRGSV